MMLTASTANHALAGTVHRSVDGAAFTSSLVLHTPLFGRFTEHYSLSLTSSSWDAEFHWKSPPKRDHPQHYFQSTGSSTDTKRRFARGHRKALMPGPFAAGGGL